MLQTSFTTPAKKISFRTNSKKKAWRTEELLANPVSHNFDIPQTYPHIVLHDSGSEDPW